MSKFYSFLPEETSCEHRGTQNGKQGKLIALCGIDGSGKTSIANYLKRSLLRKGIAVTIFNNHAGSKSPYWQSVKISKDQLASNGTSLSPDCDHILQIFEFLSFCRFSLPYLMSKYQIVITDRYAWGRIVYGRIKAGKDNSLPEQVLRLANDIPTPEVTYLLKVPPKDAYNRVIQRGKTLEWKENIEVMELADEIYAQTSDQIQNLVEINASGSIRSVGKTILENLMKIFPELSN